MGERATGRKDPGCRRARRGHLGLTAGGWLGVLWGASGAKRPELEVVTPTKTKGLSGHCRVRGKL